MSDLDAEGVILEITENAPQLEGYGPWAEASIHTYGDAKRLGLARAHFVIESPDGDDSMIHLVADEVATEQQRAPEFGPAVDRAYDMTDHKNGIPHD